MAATIKLQPMEKPFNVHDYLHFLDSKKTYTPQQYLAINGSFGHGLDLADAVEKVFIYAGAYTVFQIKKECTWKQEDLSVLPGKFVWYLNNVFPFHSSSLQKMEVFLF